MTDHAALNPVVFDADPLAKLKRFAARSGRALYRAMAVYVTRRALSELPDYLLTDLGIARGDIPFVAKSLFDSKGDASRAPTHPVNRSVIHRRSAGATNRAHMGMPAEEPWRKWPDSGYCGSVANHR